LIDSQFDESVVSFAVICNWGETRPHF